MYLSLLQKYILSQCYFSKGKKCLKKDLVKFYNNQKIKPKKIQKILTKSADRLIKKELAVAYGERTARKWYIKEIKLTSLGRKIAKQLRGEQQHLLLTYKNMKNKILAVFVLIFSLMPFLASADGGFFPPPNYYMRETEQKAVIFYDQGIETLIVSSSFQGDAKDFGWIIPVPNKPEVGKSSDELFTALNELTNAPTNYYPQKGIEIMSDSATQGGVEIIENKKVEYYDITVLKAAEENSLVQWLRNNNFQFPSEASYVFNDYIQNNWYFVAIKIDTANSGFTVNQQLKSGHATPIKLVFEAKNIVYPLKISGVQKYFNATPPYFAPGALYKDLPNQEGVSFDERLAPSYFNNDYASVLLYIFAENKKDLPNFSTQYANKIKSQEIKKLAIDSVGNPWISPKNKKYFLTKLYQNISISEMTYDLFPRDASDNKSVNAGISDRQNILLSVLMFIVFVVASLFIVLSPLGFLFIIFTFVQFLSKTKPLHIIAWVFQILSTLLLILIGCAFFLFKAINTLNMTSFFYFQQPSFSIIFLVIYSVSIASMIGIMIYQIYRKK